MKKIKLMKEIQINAVKQKNKIIAYDINTVNIILGTTSAGSNLHLYNIKKLKHNEWEIPITTIKSRIEKIEKDIMLYQAKVNLLKQIVKEVK
jgi:hypothetical protein